MRFQYTTKGLFLVFVLLSFVFGCLRYVYGSGEYVRFDFNVFCGKRIDLIKTDENILVKYWGKVRC